MNQPQKRDQVGSTQRKSGRLFVYPVLGGRDLSFARLAGPGLGNMLFPWARAAIFQLERGAIPIMPTWAQLKVGPLLRREADSRTYRNLFKPSTVEVVGYKRLLLLSTARRINESEVVRLPREWAPTNNAIATFQGMKGMFLPLNGYQEYLRDRLVACTRPEHLGKPQSSLSTTVGIHVRLGDFMKTDHDRLVQGGSNTRLPIGWYVSSLRALRAGIGANIPAMVFSDGRKDEIECLLREPNLTLAPKQSSLADLHTLSRTSVVIASASTFSMWAAYLGGMPSIWYPGQRPFNFAKDDGRQVEFGPEAGPLTAAFFAQVNQFSVFKSVVNESPFSITP